MKTKKLTFGELKIGDRFISFPTDGDNSGHGGYLGTHNVFIKIRPCYELLSMELQKKSININSLFIQNAVSSEHGTLSQMPDKMHVIKISK